MLLIRSKKAVLAFAFLALAACGSDSSGPGSVGADDAFQSLSLGLGSGTPGGLPFALAPSALGTAARGIDQIDVSIDGTTHSMYALGLRVTYPEDICFETVFVDPSNPLRICSPLPLGLVLVLWQTESGSRPPKRIAFISADVGTADFGALFAPGEFNFGPPSFAIYINDREEFWTSAGGSLTSVVTPGTETCSVPAPPFAASSTCHFATFDEIGRITFERFDFDGFGPSSFTAPRATMDFVIPRQSLRGIVQTITAVTPITFPGPWDY